MAKRVATTLVGLPLIIAIISAGGIWLRCAVLAISLIGLYEYYNAISKKNLAIHFVGYIFTVIYFLFILSDGVLSIGGYAYLYILLTAFILCAQSCLVIFYKKITLMDCIATISGFFYVPFLLSFIYLVRDYHNYGFFFTWLIFISAFGCDTFAYLTGRAIGRNKLKDTPSPGKTWEGVLGGVAGATVVGIIYGLCIEHFIAANAPGITINAAAVSMAGAVFAVFGDLFASAVKRYTGIKDFGSILPGHGGILDRFDSVVVTAPVVYMVVIAIFRNA